MSSAGTIALSGTRKAAILLSLLGDEPAATFPTRICSGSPRRWRTCRTFRSRSPLEFWRNFRR